MIDSVRASFHAVFAESDLEDAEAAEFDAFAATAFVFHRLEKRRLSKVGLRDRAISSVGGGANEIGCRHLKDRPTPGGSVPRVGLGVNFKQLPRHRTGTVPSAEDP